MNVRLAGVSTLDTVPPIGPVHRSILAVDLEGSTRRTNPAKGELRRILYRLADRALSAAGVTGQHLEEPADRGDGVLFLIRPYDDVPKTALLARLIPVLTILLDEHNASVHDPSLRMRLRVVVHAGDVHIDDWGFYGEELDVAFRLLDSPTVKRTLSEVQMSPLVLVISEEIFRTIVRHGYLGEARFEPTVRVRVADRVHRGWVHAPIPGIHVPPLVNCRTWTSVPPRNCIAGPAAKPPLQAAGTP